MQLTINNYLNYTREDLNKMGYSNEEINKVVYPEEIEQ
jgi:hypothetical protein